MAEFTCVRCGQQSGDRRYFDHAGLCDACHWDGYIPPGFAIRESYAFDESWGHQNATRHPAVGVEFLDVRTARVASSLLPLRNRPRG